MRYRICKMFEVESGHMLSKHHGRCRHPHGHTRRIEVILSSDHLNDSDMVCDFKALKLAIIDFIDRFDHAMAINSEDSHRPLMEKSSERLIVFDKKDPTTEVLAKHIFDAVSEQIQSKRTITDDQGHTYTFPDGLQLDRIRIWETSSTWAEYGRP